MDFEKEYNILRPYNDAEAPEAMSRILNDENFKHIISYLYEDRKIEDVLREYQKIKTVREFQLTFSHYAVRKVIEKTSDGLTYSGLDKLSNKKAYLFISNHRDIVLDSAIMQILLVENNHETSQITFGSNLMSSNFIIDLGKMNKMFTFYRGGTKIQMYKNALLHSKYIQRVITEENESVWIAQRDGRTKDGDDKTQISLIKMLTMGKDNPFEALKELNIVPVSISYEYEPCDSRKIQEKYISKYGEYKKQKGEDFDSVLKGITNYKGRIHMAFGEPINNVIEKAETDNLDSNELVDIVAKSIDNQIYKNYILRPINYFATDILLNQKKYLNDKYNEEDVKKYSDFFDKKVTLLKGDKQELKQMLLNLYAMPYRNKNITE